MPRRDSFDLFRAANPVNQESTPGADSNQGRALLSEILATPHPLTDQRRTPSHRPRARRRLVLVIALVAVAVFTVAAGVVLFRSVDDPVSIACYQAPSLDADIVAVASGTALNPQACRTAWESGLLTNPQMAAEGTVPTLVGCVGTEGNLLVFPTDSDLTCADLGLADPYPSSVEDGDRLRELNDAIVSYLDTGQCVQLSDAESEIRTLLDSRGYTDWAIIVMAPHPDRPCASHAFEPLTKTIRIVPIPAP